MEFQLWINEETTDDEVIEFVQYLGNEKVTFTITRGLWEELDRPESISAEF